MASFPYIRSVSVLLSRVQSVCFKGRGARQLVISARVAQSLTQQLLVPPRHPPSCACSSDTRGVRHLLTSIPLAHNRCSNSEHTLTTLTVLGNGIGATLRSQQDLVGTFSPGASPASSIPFTPSQAFRITNSPLPAAGEQTTQMPRATSPRASQPLRTPTPASRRCPRPACSTTSSSWRARGRSSPPQRAPRRP